MKQLTFSIWYGLFLLLLIPKFIAAQLAFSLDGTNYNVGENIAVDKDGNTFIIGNFRGTLDCDPSDAVFELTSKTENITDVFIASYTSTGQLRFAFSLRGSLNGDHLAKGITIDAEGNIYVTGRFYGTADFDPSSAENNLVSENLLYGNAFVASYDNDGNYRHAFSLNIILVEESDELLELKTDAAGNIYMTGTYGGIGVIDFDPGTDVFELPPGISGVSNFLASYDANGNFRYAINIGISGGGNANHFAIDENGNSYVVGRFIGTFDFDPSDEVFNLVADDDFDVFIASYDTDGNFRYAERIDHDTNPFNPSFRIAVDPAGNINLTGYFGGTMDFDVDSTVNEIDILFNDFFLASYTNDFALRYVFTLAVEESIFDTLTYAYPTDITTDELGNTYITGVFKGTIDFDPSAAVNQEVNPLFSNGEGFSDIFMVSYNNQGAYRYSSRMGSLTNNDSGSHPKVAITKPDESCVTGAVGGKVYYNDITNQYEVESGSHYNAVVFCMNDNSPTTSVAEEGIPGLALSIFPNPSSKQIHISTKAFAEVLTLNIISGTGATVFSTLFSNTMLIDVSNYSRGQYWISIVDKKGKTMTRSFVVN